LRRDGTVWAWGDDSLGELGRESCRAGGPPARSGRSPCPRIGSPVPVRGLGQVKAIASGSDTAYALRRDGSVWAWGANSFGALGYALDGHGRLWAWGSGFYGQLGNGRRETIAHPTLVPGLSPLTTAL